MGTTVQNACRFAGHQRVGRVPRLRTWLIWLALAGSVAAPACGRLPVEYELNGQVLAIDQARQEITIKHGDIRGFMPGMTMPFRVKDAGLLAGRTPGDLVRATLVVSDSDVYLRTVERTGHAPLSQPATDPSPRTLAPGEPVADAELVDETGRTLRLAESRGNVVAVTFMYTRCPLPNFCPVMDRHFKAVQDRVRADDRLRGRVRLLSVTIDSTYDTPPVLARHAAALQADPAIWRFATGPPETVHRFGAQFGVSTPDGAREPADIVHNLRTAVIDREGRLAIVLNGSQWTPTDLIEALRNAY